MDQHQSGETGSGLELETHACGRGKLAHIVPFETTRRSEIWKQ